MIGGLVQMAECTLLETCIFFNDKMSDMPSMANMYKQRYCKGDMMQCARYQVFKEVGRENVPTDLYPNDSDRVAVILAKIAG